MQSTKGQLNMSGEKNLGNLIASMKPILIENEYVFGTIETCNVEKLVLLNPISTFQEKEGLTVVVQKEKADEYKVSYTGVFRCITLNVHSSLDAVGLTVNVIVPVAENTFGTLAGTTFFATRGVVLTDYKSAEEKTFCKKYRRGQVLH